MNLSDLDKLGKRCPKCKKGKLSGNRILVCDKCGYKETQYGLGNWC